MVDLEFHYFLQQIVTMVYQNSTKVETLIASSLKTANIFIIELSNAFVNNEVITKTLCTFTLKTISDTNKNVMVVPLQ